MAGRRQRTAIAGGIVAGAVAGSLAGVRQVYRGAVPPHGGRVVVAGLDGRVDITRDSDGIPHVRASTEGDALAGLGYCHAQDRLWQMELIRRIIRGTLAELVGKEAIATDRYARTLGLARVAEDEAAALADDDRAAVEAYCRGVNAYLEGPGFRLPLELRLLVRRRVERWTVGDALLGMRVFALTLSQNWEGEIVRSRLVAKLGAERFAQLEPGYPADGYTSLPASAAEAVRAALETRARAGGVEGAGSNNWVLAADAHHDRRAAARERSAPAAGSALHLVRRRYRVGRRARRGADARRHARDPDRPERLRGLGLHERRGRHAGPARGRARRQRGAAYGGDRRPRSPPARAARGGDDGARAGGDAARGRRAPDVRAAVDGAAPGRERAGVPGDGAGPCRGRHGRRPARRRRPDAELRLRDAGRGDRVPDVRRAGARARERRRPVPVHRARPARCRTRSCRPGAIPRAARSSPPTTASSTTTTRT